VALVEPAAVGRQNAHPLVRPQHAVDHGNEQQAGGKDRYAYRCSQLLLVDGQKAAGGGDGADTGALQLLGRLYVGRQQPAAPSMMTRLVVEPVTFR